jgi:hypothetical protein
MELEGGDIMKDMDKKYNDIDVFQDGGLADIDLNDIVSLYGGIQQKPVTKEDIRTEMESLSGLYTQPKRMSIYDLATELSRGLAAQAQSGQAPSIGTGLALGFQSFSDVMQKRKDESDKIKSELQQLAFAQAQQRKQQEAELSKEVLEMQFDAALKAKEDGIFKGTSIESSALNFILRAENDLKFKDTPEYRVALAIAGRPRQQIVQTEKGAIVQELPALDIEKILTANTGIKQTIIEGGRTYTYSGKSINGKPVYLDENDNPVFVGDQ